jgi:hypothetical protein
MERRHWRVVKELDIGWRTHSKAIRAWIEHKRGTPPDPPSEMGGRRVSLKCPPLSEGGSGGVICPLCGSCSIQPDQRQLGFPRGQRGRQGLYLAVDRASSRLREALGVRPGSAAGSARGKKINRDSENGIPTDYNLLRFSNYRRFSSRDPSIIFSSPGETAANLACLSDRLVVFAMRFFL